MRLIIGDIMLGTLVAFCCLCLLLIAAFFVILFVKWCKGGCPLE